MHKALHYLGWPLLAGLLAALLVIQQFPEWVGLPASFRLPGRAVTLAQPGGSYAGAVSLAAPAVVNLYTLRGDTGASPSRQQRINSSLGSAVIMSPEGYLLTNYHVTANAEQIVVALRDGRETRARLVGSDPETDLAVLKISLPDLPAIPAGHSEQAQVGDVTLAIGNPFGLGQTVTMGIISATGRNQLGLNTYEDFIQTDAAINRGNSGGALVDVQGRLIGINAAIISESGGSQGIGLAIPVRLAMEVMEAIIRQGQVIRGWLGVEVQPLPREQARTAGLQSPAGIMVTGMAEHGPAAEAGLQTGDIILAINGTAATDGRTSMNQVARTRPGDLASLQILRAGQPLTLRARVGQRPLPPMQE